MTSSRLRPWATGRKNWLFAGTLMAGQRAAAIMSLIQSATGVLDRGPSGDARRALPEDYQRMVQLGLLLHEAEPFDALLHHCQALADKVNAVARRST